MWAVASGTPMFTQRRMVKGCINCVRSLSSAAPASRFGVVGCGQMGIGIAIVAARHAELEVLAFDTFPQSVEKGKKFVSSWAAKEVAKGRMSEEDRSRFEGRFRFGTFEDTSMLSDMSTVDFVVEAVTEDQATKQLVYQKLQDAGLSDQAVLATNTSSISITKLGAKVTRPERFIGMHFMNPVPVMPLVEVIKGLQTDDSTLEKTLRLCSLMKKETATSEDRPGFVANRILMPYINEAIFTLQDGIASAVDIDKTMKLGTNVPMGPLTLADFIGLDTCLSIMQVLHRDLGDSKYRPAPLLVNYVEAGYRIDNSLNPAADHSLGGLGISKYLGGWLGKKTGRGFYAY